MSDSNFSDALNSFINQIPTILMLSKKKFNYKMLLITLFPLIISYIRNFKFKEKTITESIPTDYKKITLLNDNSTTITFLNLSHLLKEYFNDQLSNLEISGLASDELVNYNGDVFKPESLIKENTLIDCVFTDEILNDLDKKGFNILNINYELLKNNKIYVYIDIESIIKNKNNEDIKKNVLCAKIYAKEIFILYEFLKIILNLDNIKTLKNIKYKSKKNIVCGNDEYYTNRLQMNTYKTFNNIFLSKENEKITNLLDEWKHNIKENKRLGIPPKLGLMFCGVPGCGKSSCIYAISNYLEKDIYDVDLNDIDSISFMEFARNIRNKIIVLEELDCYDFSKERNDSIENKDKKDKDKNIHIKDMLDVLDGYNYTKNCVFIITSNHPEKIDEAIKRPGRVDHIIEFKLCDEYQFNNIFNYFLNLDYKKINPNFEFNENKFSTSYIINSIILPNKSNPNRILELLTE